MYQLIKALLFRLDPETAHHFTFLFFRLPGARLLAWLSAPKRKHDGVDLFGLHFPNRIGLAAGLDKNAVAFDALGALGFGFVEIGTVTPLPQPGNPRPRLFRLVKDSALINRMGFNNDGAEAVARRLANRGKGGAIIGGNIGKNKQTPNESALDDYLKCFEALHEVVDYFVVNVSSPNTPNLRELQEKEPLKAILMTLQDANRAKPAQRPILLKIAPDLTDSQLDDIIDIVNTTGIDGVIATNTTIERKQLKTPAAELERIGAGGLSGKPLAARSTEVIRYLKMRSGNAFPVIGVGGIHSAHDALEKLDAGADLIQLYTGFIYEGPALVRRIARAIASREKK